ncbi:hypothetical protein BBJ28_00017163, partial [Nothophytophthora sp. Chile5]
MKGLGTQPTLKYAFGWLRNLLPFRGLRGWAYPYPSPPLIPDRTLEPLPTRLCRLNIGLFTLKSRLPTWRWSFSPLSTARATFPAEPQKPKKPAQRTFTMLGRIALRNAALSSKLAAAKTLRPMAIHTSGLRQEEEKSGEI